ncbi:MAG TPA: hypothetical protein DCM86_15930 [Verrucomicrobiales bacterium]|nr:hypothetical protein [Verrucomicrobiales bacterium]
MRIHRLILCAAVLATGAASAQIKPTDRPVRRMALSEAVAQALQSNIGISINRLTRDMVGYDLKAASAIYDPVYTFTMVHSDASRAARFDPTTGINTLATAAQSDSVQNSITGYAPSGLTYTLGLNFAHSFGDRGFSTFDDYTANIGLFQLRQPLLKNMWIDANRQALRVQRLVKGASDLDFQFQIMTLVREVYKAYYDLAYADEQVKISFSAHELAAQLAHDIKRRVEVGTLAPLEEKQAESQSQTEYANYIENVQRRNTAENHLKDLIASRFKETYNEQLEPSEKLLSVGREVDLQESWNAGFQKRPDYRRRYLDLEARKVDLVFAKNQILPSLDLIGTYGRNGLDSGGPLNQSTLEGAFHDIRRNSQPYDTYGVVLSMPLTLHRERANLHKAKAEREQGILLLKQTEQTVLVSIDNAIGNVRGSLIRIKARRQARELAEEALAAEEKKLARGVVSPSEVLRKQQDLTRTRSEEILAILDYNQALSELEYADGTILERNHIALEPVK